MRDRPEDVVSLARHLVTKTCSRLGMKQLRLDSTALDCLTSYKWPGNVRELENVLERAAVLCKESVIRPEDLPAAIIQTIQTPLRSPSGVGQSLKEVEQGHIQVVLESVGGNRTQAAKILGISTTTLWRRLRAQ